MEVESQEEVINNAIPKDHGTLVVKGKRTKRQRPQSPTPFSVSAANSSYDNDSSPSLSLSPATSAANDQDMANCLILLAQGHSRGPPLMQAEDGNSSGTQKLNSRKFFEATNQSGVGTGKSAGYYVYECKTCNRVFPSFQALGGHRASHKKPRKAIIVSEKIMVNSNHSNEKINHGQYGLPSLEEQDHHLQSQFKSHYNSSNSLYGIITSNSKNNNTKSSSTKLHECSVCGAEFTSGQALGGHMRRHRGAATTALSLSTNVIAATPLMVLDTESDRDDHDHDHDQHRKRARNVMSLDLDLNLPAPEDDQHRDSKFGFVNSKQRQQQTSLVFPDRALVDCHYSERTKGGYESFF